ncbi:MAG: hypothetical protein HOI42_13950 [Candidatus Marinimicrobia bacterium]|jgi:hypothetical protein|nr:hypothetical protein [Candidatus Neomarinimicrobiota bacterium]
MKKVKVKITNGTIVHGMGDVRPGKVIQVDHGTARQLFIAGKAVPCADEPEKPATKSDQDQDKDPGKKPAKKPATKSGKAKK